MEKTALREILDQMTLQEKASLCSGSTFWLTEPVERLGIPAVWLSDGPHGLRKEKMSSGASMMRPAETATCFPSSATTANSWDESLLEEIGNAIAEEARALRVTTVLGPGVNIKRSPLCGRNFEYLSEDPFFSGRIGAAYVRGVQKNGVGVSLKHYCANNQESMRMSIDSIVDERTLHETYLPAFEYIVKTEQPKTVMASYNRLNGAYLTEHEQMLTEVLRDRWGFDGLVVSDWGAVSDRVAGVRAGLDLEMPGINGANDRKIVEAVLAGTLQEEALNRVVLRILKFVFESKENETAGSAIEFAAHHALARKAAAQSAILLKNERSALPLKKEQSVAVVGMLAKEMRYQGSGSSHIDCPKPVSFTQALDAAGQPYAYADGYTLKGDGYQPRLVKEACNAAAGKDAVLVFIGLPDAYESEGFDRANMRLPESHNILLRELAKVSRNIIAVLSCGAPVEIGDWEKDVNAILNLYLGGQAVGEAAYDLIYGSVNPSGKLAETYPFRYDDNIVSRYFPMGPRTVEYRESIFVGYRYFDAVQKPVRYPFGFGLSYTSFRYSDLKLSADTIRESDGLVVSFRVANTGAVAGAEVAQLYVGDEESTAFRPQKELKGFQKVFLQPGEEALVELRLDARAFAYYNTLIHDWHVESGAFTVSVGSSSRDIRLHGRVSVLSDNPQAPLPDDRKSCPCYYNLSAYDEIPSGQFAALYGAQLMENTPYRKGELTANNTIDQLACSGFGRALRTLVKFTGVQMAAQMESSKEMIAHMLLDMPLRTLSGFAGGAMTEEVTESLVDMCNSKKGGFRRFLKAIRKSAH